MEARLAFVLLTGAIFAEIIGTSLLKSTEGFTRITPTIICLTAYGAAFYFLAKALEHGMRTDIAYALWSGIGVFAIAMIGITFFGQPFSVVKLVGIVLIIGGVVTLSLAGVH